MIAIRDREQGHLHRGRPAPHRCGNSLRATCAYICAAVRHHRALRPPRLPQHDLPRRPAVRHAAAAAAGRVANLLGRRLSHRGDQGRLAVAARGDTGPMCWRAAQYLLRDAGTLRGNADGRFDDRTRAAVAEFRSPTGPTTSAASSVGVWPELARTVRAGTGRRRPGGGVLARYRRTERARRRGPRSGSGSLGTGGPAGAVHQTASF
ncbi:peptidoglycan-binding protein [Pseudonocardia sp. MCCB 268]|nr:peptidoglycan-binding protein [Pseudonocardia cytotoxica]